MKLLRNGETVEQPIELILPMYVHHKYKLMWNSIEMTFELLTYIEPFNARDIDIFNLQPNENSVALKFISKGKGYDAAYLNEKLAPMYPGKKSIPKKTYKSLLESLENGLIEIQRQVTARELFLEDMFI